MTLIEKIQEYCNKVERKPMLIDFHYNNGIDFSASSEAENVVKEGFKMNYGSMCCDDPIAISKACSYIAKWRNIGPDEYHKMDGFLISLNFREDDVAIVLFK